MRRHDEGGTAMLTRDLEQARYEAHLADIRQFFEKEAAPGDTVFLAAAARYLGIAPVTLLDIKDFPAIKVGGRYKVSKVGLAKWLAMAES